MLSLLLNLKNRPCLVVGSGAVGRRKVQTLFESGAKVRVVSLDVQPVDVRAEFLCEPCSAKHLQGIFLTFAAATSAVNAQVVLDTQSQGILVSSADHPESGDFILPATVNRGDLTIAVSTGGASPFLAKNIRNQLAIQFDESYSLWLEVLQELRGKILEGVQDPALRRELFQKLADGQWLEHLRREGQDSLRQHLLTLARISHQSEKPNRSGERK